MRAILKTGNNILVTQGKIFQVGESKPPIVDLDPAALTLTHNALAPQIPDRINGNNAVQLTAINQGTFLTNEINGFPAIQFSGGQYYQLIQGVVAKTIFIVCKSSQPIEGGTLFSDGLVFGNDYNYWGPGSDRYGAVNDSYFYSLSPNFGGDSTNKIFVNGSSIPSEPKSNVKRNTFYTLMTLDNAAQQKSISLIGTNGFYNLQDVLIAYFRGSIGRIIVYDYRMTDLDRQAKAQELKTYYGL